MSDFNPETLFFIVYESMGLWLWLLLGLAVVLLIGIVTSAIRLHRSGRPMTRPVMAAVIVGLLASVAITFVVPAWTLAGADALTGAIDYAFAFLFALVPGAILAALVFMMAANRCARRGELSRRLPEAAIIKSAA